MKIALSALTALGLTVAAPAFAQETMEEMDPMQTNCSEYIAASEEDQMAMAAAAAGENMTAEEAMDTLSDNCREDGSEDASLTDALTGESN